VKYQIKRKTAAAIATQQQQDAYRTLKGVFQDRLGLLQLWSLIKIAQLCHVATSDF